MFCTKLRSPNPFNDPWASFYSDGSFDVGNYWFQYDSPPPPPPPPAPDVSSTVTSPPENVEDMTIASSSSSSSSSFSQNNFIEVSIFDDIEKDFQELGLHYISNKTEEEYETEICFETDNEDEEQTETFTCSETDEQEEDDEFEECPLIIPAESYAIVYKKSVCILEIIRNIISRQYAHLKIKNKNKNKAHSPDFEVIKYNTRFISPTKSVQFYVLIDIVSNMRIVSKVTLYIQHYHQTHMVKTIPIELVRINRPYVTSVAFIPEHEFLSISRLCYDSYYTDPSLFADQLLRLRYETIELPQEPNVPLHPDHQFGYVSEGVVFSSKFSLLNSLPQLKLQEVLYQLKFKSESFEFLKKCAKKFVLASYRFDLIIKNKRLKGGDVFF